MDRRNTLTSKTVQCPYCGEYYSVTYSSCPFCDGAQREAEAEKEQKETRRAQSRPRTSGNEQSRRQSRSARPEKPASSGGFLGKLFSGTPSEPSTRNLTPEERAERRALREERAAQRKRERDRLAGIETYDDYEVETVPEEPAAEEMEVREFSISTGDGEPVIDLAALLAQVVGEKEGKKAPAAQDAESEPAAAEAPAEAPEQPAEPAPEMPAAPAEPEQPAPAAAPAAPEEPAPREPVSVPVQEKKPAAPARHAKPEAKQPFRFPLSRQADESENLPQIVDLNDYPVEEERPAVPAPEESRPAPQAAAPAGSAPAEENAAPAAGDDLDALLAEVRSMLGESPVPDISERPDPSYFAVEEPVSGEGGQPEQAEEEAVSDDAVNSILAEVAALLHNSPVQELLHRGKPAEEERPAAPAEEEPMPEESAAPVDEAPAEPAAEDIPGEMPQDEGYAEALAAEEEPAPAEEPLPTADEEREARRAARREERKKKNKKKSPVTPQMILSVVIILIAVAILVHAFGGKKPAEPEPEAAVEVVPDTCESFTLDQTDITVNEAGVTVPLTVIFQPEGTSATLTWTSSDENVAAVDQNGTVTAVGPGTAWISASSASGLSAGCNVSCSWEGSADAGTASASGPKLSSTDITLDSSGATKLLTVEGASSIVTWSSDNSSVARVASDGTVTAINKGNATISAVVDGETLVCKVRCVW